ncbi:TolC family protein [Larkinella sp.]|uniref:TolC family protein n=1 Tax=Larkinella sp. TaxID=2034517 RepID=UPI003BAC2A59
MISNRVVLLFLLGRRVVLFVFLGLLLSYVSYGQKSAQKPANSTQQALPVSDTIALDINQDLSTQLLSLEELLTIALTKSPLTRLENESIDATNAEYKLSKIEILQSASGFTNYSFGNQAIFSTTSMGPDALGQIANGYRTGVGLQINLFDIFGRTQKIRKARAVYRQAQAQKEITSMRLHRDLVATYQDLMTSQRILKIQFEDEQVLRTAFQITETESRKGKVEPDDMAAASRRYAQAKIQTEQAKGEFLKNISYLEILVGLPIQQLKRN